VKMPQRNLGLFFALNIYPVNKVIFLVSYGVVFC